MAYNSNSPTQSNKNNKAERNIRYLDRDFNSFRNSLIEFSKTYFPDTYTDFSPSSPGMMFMEMSSYVGDVLSFYQDNQIQETFTQYAKQTPNLYQLAYMMGYKPKITGAAVADISIFTIVPSTGGSPDFSYAPTIPNNTIVNSSINGQASFVTQDFVDFAVSNTQNPTEVSVYSVAGDSPTQFLLKKNVKAISAEEKTVQFSFGSYEKFPTITIQDENIIGITECVDESTNKWYEVPYIGQETVFLPQKNVGGDTPYLLKLLRTQNRFATRFLSKNQLQIQFGSGDPGITDTNVIPNPGNVGKGGNNLSAGTAFAPDNFTFTNTYGSAPVNTTLTFTYLRGGGISSNASAGTITNIDTSKVTFDNGNTGNLGDITCTNEFAATGGTSGDTPDQIRENSLRMFGTQMRSVTQDDYTVRALSMPGVYGAVAKIFVEPEKIENLNPHSRPAVLDMYVLGYDSNKNCITPSNNFKDNLSTYLSQYRMVNDTISIKNGFVINIGINFSIIARPNYAGNVVLAKCITFLQDYFSIDKWQINQPIFLTDIYTLLDRVEGVQTVKSVEAYNKSGGQYSQYSYDVVGATLNNTVFPSQDPSIFEVKFPNKDIKGSITNF